MGTSSRRTIALICILLLVSFTLQVSAEPWWKRQPQQSNNNNNNSNNNNNNPNNNSSSNSNSGNSNSNNSGGQNSTNSGGQTSDASAGPQPTGNTTTNSTTSSNTTSSSNSTSSPTKSSSATSGVGPAAIQLTTPSITQNKPLYKIGSNVTFAWKWLNQPIIKPQYLLVLAQATLGKTMYQIANLSANASSCLWITAEQNPPLVMSDYNLYITDERGISGTPSATRMQPYSGLIFSMYLPQSYTDLDGYTCATCYNDGSFPFVPIFMTVGVTIITVVTFGFFMV